VANVVAVMPIHGRELVTKASVSILKQQTHVCAVLLVGDEKKDEDLAVETGSFFVYCPNEILSFKYQAGFDAAREFNPDAVLLCGSDDFLSWDWVRLCYEKIESGFDLVGKSVFWICVAFPGRKAVLYKCSYCQDRIAEPMGAGRLFSRKILDKTDWYLFPEMRKRGCDGLSYGILLANGARIALMNHEDRINLVLVKSDWRCTTPYRQILSPSGKNVRTGWKLLEVVDGAGSWFASCFPGAKNIYRRQYPGAW